MTSTSLHMPESIFAMRKVLPIFVSTMLLAIALIVVWQSVVLNEKYFPVNELQLVGTFEQVDADALKVMLTPELGRNFFDLPVERIHNQIAGLPWVRQVWVDRVFPDTVRLRVQEQKPVARWGDTALLNDQGAIFSASIEGFDDLPALSGPEGNLKEVLAFFQAAQASLDKYGLVIKQAEMDDRHSWQLTVNNMTVMLGRQEHEQRLKRLGIYWESLKAARQQEIAKIDLRYANGFAVRWAKTPLSRESH